MNSLKCTNLDKQEVFSKEGKQLPGRKKELEGAKQKRWRNELT